MAVELVVGEEEDDDGAGEVVLKEGFSGEIGTDGHDIIGMRSVYINLSRSV